MSKVLNPKAWYLVGIGAVALAADGVRRLIRKRREEAEQTPSMVPYEEEYIPLSRPAAAADSKSPTDSARSTVVTPVTKTTPAVKPARPQKADDLTEIKGIGPAFAKRLTEAGITTFAALAAASPDHLREIAKAPAMTNPEEWIAQAELKRS